VLLQTVVVAPPDWHPASDPAPFDRLQDVSRELLQASARLGVRTEWLTTVSAHPMEEIARVAQLHRCSSVLLGLSEISEDERGSRLERLLGRLDTDVVVLRSRLDWRFEHVKKICVPVAGRGSHEQLLALLLGSVLRHNPCEVTFLRIVPTAADPRELRRAQRSLKQIADDNIRGKCQVELVTSDDPLTAICSRAEESDLLILGAQRQSRRRKLFGDFTRQIAQRTSCPIIVLSRRG
jgi:nucleotide-binding universal stress UspA family protein